MGPTLSACTTFGDDHLHVLPARQASNGVACARGMTCSGDHRYEDEVDCVQPPLLPPACEECMQRPSPSDTWKSSAGGTCDVPPARTCRGAESRLLAMITVHERASVSGMARHRREYSPPGQRHGVQEKCFSCARSARNIEAS
jgi:hypothetical protein